MCQGTCRMMARSALGLLLLLGTLLVQATAQDADAAILLEWKSTFTASPNLGPGLLDTWAEGTQPCGGESSSPWWALECDDVDGSGEQRVISINMDVKAAGGGVEGTFLSLNLTDKLGDLRLQILSITGATIGNRVPVNFNCLYDLVELYLIDCGISGRLPRRFVLPPNLQVLDMRDNNMTGELWQGWRTMNSLLEVWLDNNQLTGKLLMGSDMPPKLQIFSASYNFLEGPLRPWSNLAELREVYLTANRLSGTLPEAPAMPPTLAILQLGNNRFTGDFPASWPAQLSSLEQLGIQYSRLTGQLPDLGGWAGMMTSLALNGNLLRGPVPADWSAFTVLESLQLGENRFSGPLPVRLGGSLKTLELAYNQLTGALPVSWIPGCPLTRLTVQYNRGLTGSIPAEWSVPGAFLELLDPFVAAPETGLCGPIPDSIKVYKEEWDWSLTPLVGDFGCPPPSPDIKNPVDPTGTVPQTMPSPNPEVLPSPSPSPNVTTDISTIVPLTPSPDGQVPPAGASTELPPPTTNPDQGAANAGIQQVAPGAGVLPSSPEPQARIYRNPNRSVGPGGANVQGGVGGNGQGGAPDPISLTTNVTASP